MIKNHVYICNSGLQKNVYIFEFEIKFYDVHVYLILHAKRIEFTQRYYNTCQINLFLVLHVEHFLTLRNSQTDIEFFAFTEIIYSKNMRLNSK